MLWLKSCGVFIERAVSCDGDFPNLGGCSQLSILIVERKRKDPHLSTFSHVDSSTLKNIYGRNLPVSSKNILSTPTREGSGWRGNEKVRCGMAGISYIYNTGWLFLGQDPIRMAGSCICLGLFGTLQSTWPAHNKGRIPRIALTIAYAIVTQWLKYLL